ncbi:MAG: glycosyltransferase N-terminal domain-containing protein [Paracoccaceae bacterium]
MFIYRLFMAFALPFLLLWQLRGPKGTLPERLGLTYPAKPGPSLWLHGASNGEITSARWLLECLITARPDLQILVTCNTPTARAMVRGWNLPGVTAAFAPIDSAFATHRVLNRWHPHALISLEGELWPSRLAACHAHNTPVILLGARMSARSFRRWNLIRPLAAKALGTVALASAQDPASREYLSQLGLPKTAFGPDFDLKAQAAALLPPAQFQLRETRAHWLLAASTHDGEDAAILDAFKNAPNFTHLIIAPRHPARATAIAALVTARNLPFTRRSTGAMPSTGVFLADTMGEMDLWYARAGACIIGGTFANKGGHSPWEPVRFGCAILHGPSTTNFASPFATLDAADAALPVTAQTLATALQTLDALQQNRLSDAANGCFRAKMNTDALVKQLLTISGV